MRIRIQTQVKIWKQLFQNCLLWHFWFFFCRNAVFWALISSFMKLQDPVPIIWLQICNPSWNTRNGNRNRKYCLGFRQIYTAPPPSPPQYKPAAYRLKKCIHEWSGRRCLNDQIGWESWAVIGRGSSRCSPESQSAARLQLQWGNWLWLPQPIRVDLYVVRLSFRSINPHYVKMCKK